MIKIVKTVPYEALIDQVLVVDQSSLYGVDGMLSPNIAPPMSMEVADSWLKVLSPKRTCCGKSTEGLVILGIQACRNVAENHVIDGFEPTTKHFGCTCMNITNNDDRATGRLQVTEKSLIALSDSDIALFLAHLLGGHEYRKGVEQIGTEICADCKKTKAMRRSAGCESAIEGTLERSRS